MKMMIDTQMGWCPVCGQMMDAVDREIAGDYVNEHWLCNACEIDVTYAFPLGHLVLQPYADGEILIEIEPFAS